MPDDEINAIRDWYNLGEISDVADVPHLRGTLITLQTGQVVLRPVMFASQIQRLLYDEAFTNYLSRQGFPARRLLRTQKGSLTCSAGGQKYVLAQFIAGSVVSSSEPLLTLDQIAEAAITLARLHALATDYDGPKSLRLPLTSTKSSYALTRVAQALAERPVWSSFDEVAAEVVRRKLEFIAKEPFELQPFLHEYRLVNHGDYHPGNIVFRDDGRIAAVLDFELCAELPRVWDLAWALTWIGQERRTEAFAGKMIPSRLSHFLTAYNAVNPLSKAEQSSLALVCRSACFHSNYILDKVYAGKPIGDLEMCYDADDWLWWSNHVQDVTELIKEACMKQRVR